MTVQARALDSSGRTIWASDYLWTWWERVVADLGFTPTIVQGAWMTRSGGGAAASAGYHDQGGCLDLRVWDRTQAEVEQVIRTTRRFGAASWVRDAQRGGFDPHIHLVLGADEPLAGGAAWQWQQYIDGRDGLSSGGRDYHSRPDPLITTPPPPEDTMNPAQEKKVDDLARDVATILKRLDADAVIRTRLDVVVKKLETVLTRLGNGKA